jgi:hypothetical protein
MGLALLAERLFNMSRASWALSAGMFASILLAGVAFLSGLISLWNALRWRPSLPDEPPDA